jgi:hypothetical protein
MANEVKRDDELPRSELLYDDPLVAVLPKDYPSLFGKILSLCSEAGFSRGSTAAWASVTLLVEAGEGSIGLMVAWSPHREGPVLHEFLKLARKHPSWPRNRLRSGC